MKAPGSGVPHAPRAASERLRGSAGKRRRAVTGLYMTAFQIAAQAFENSAPAPKSKSSTKKKRNRLPTEDWQKVFRTLYASFDNDFGYDEVMQSVAINGMTDVKRASLRTKMMNYDGGYVERKDAGRFSITPKGIPYFKIEAQASKENEPHSGIAGGSYHGRTEAEPFLRPWETHPTVQG